MEYISEKDQIARILLKLPHRRKGWRIINKIYPLQKEWKGKILPEELSYWIIERSWV